jgi:hypothetical protein
VLKSCFLVTGAQQLEENFNLHKYGILFITYIIGFVVTGYLFLNNEVGENSGDIVFFIFL